MVKNRVLSVDLMRGWLIMLMVLVHFTENLSPAMPANPGYVFFHFFTEVITGAPVFAFIMGMSTFISMSKHLDSRAAASSAAPIRRYVRRGVALFVVGLLFAAFVWGFDATFDWDILTLLGFSAIALVPLRNLRPRTLLWVGIAIVLVSPWLRHWFGFFGDWDPPVVQYQYALSPSHILRGFLVSGYFPVFPWLAFSIFGFATGKAFLPKPNPAFLRNLFGAGVALTLVSTAAMLFAKSHPVSEYVGFYVSNWTVAYSKYPATTTFIVLSMGTCLILFSVLYAWMDLRVLGPDRRESAVVTFLSRYSTFALSVYVIHNMVHVWPLRIVSYVNGTDYLFNALPFWASLALAVVFIGVFYFVLKAWERIAGKYSLEWLLTQVVGGPSTRPQSSQQLADKTTVAA